MKKALIIGAAGFVGNYLIDHLAKFNIKATEEKIGECCSINYGQDINRALREIKSQLDVFDYHKAKELLTVLKSKEEK